MAPEPHENMSEAAMKIIVKYRPCDGVARFQGAFDLFMNENPELQRNLNLIGL